ncbi:RNase adapter RapZ [Dasania marina]|uniref:RNase adapter RapZ n=1 Tax=Dasania marina TaxID=471499 RepID=UPI0030D7AF83|tara:strand:+ start:31134 stop:32000 length:867 start_codon:yes stop_codon:yes gene_type:complete
MRLIIISGRSGSGKSSALNLLEDEGYYCIDNLPVALIPDLVTHLKQGGHPSGDKVALCIDARNSSSDLSALTLMIEGDHPGVTIEVIYLDADNDKLIKRFSETRRRHPLSNKDTGLAEAISREQKLLEPIASIATLTIDSSDMSLHDLRDTIKSRLVDKKGSSISIQFQSFGFKHRIPNDADLVYDIRILPNPHWDPALRILTGLDQPVIDFLNTQPQVDSMYEDIRSYLEKWLPAYQDSNRSYITIAIGCTGGQHRSVYMAERLAHYFADHFDNVQVRHREMPKQAT